MSNFLQACSLFTSLCLGSSIARAVSLHEIDGFAIPNSRPAEDISRPDTFAQIPADPITTRAPSLPLNEDGISALMLSMWSMASGKVPAKNLLDSARLSEASVKRFLKDLKPSEKFTDLERQALRKSFNRDSLRIRLSARSKFLAFVSRFQEKFPSTAMVVPELLTVWGEARNVRGFDDLSSYNQQAKMATVIHVIRNRSERRNMRLPKHPPHQNKWNVVTRRFQFSAFEPYDPNLAEIAMGPLTTTPYSALSALPRSDQIALRNLAKIVSRLNRGEVLLSKPLVYSNTFHYLTPSLRDYNAENLASLTSQIERMGRRFKLIHIPEKNPQFIAVVPNWSRQSALISHPPVKIKGDSNDAKPEFQTQIVSPTDFIYFRGIK